MNTKRRASGLTDAEPSVTIRAWQSLVNSFSGDSAAPNTRPRRASTRRRYVSPRHGA